PVDSLMAGQIKQHVLLDWQLPITKAVVDSLFLYRDNRLLLALPDTAKHYTDSLVMAGNYVYSLVVDYGQGKLSEEAIVSIQVETYIPPVHLETIAGGVRVSPTVTEAWVTVSVPERARLQIKSLAGILLQEYPINETREVRLDYPPGIYLLLIDTGTDRHTFKVVLR
ncbi:T9SS type A sorting domain-containing protein, partial [Bacteroidales bacterium OttesenSCG-928-L03]|nr:T9SS type A sorting domain-containing protein [Bacteroidales bacterium OttesenSCG-928-L03]